jgi:hypothetical protein
VTLGGKAVSDIEQQLPIVAAPWWKPPQISIAASKETAAKEHNKLLRESKSCTRTLIVYTNSSNISGQVGAAAWCPSEEWAAQAYIGSRSAYTVYSAELLGIHYALGIALHRNGLLEQIESQTNILGTTQQQARQQERQQWCNKVIVFTDN